MEGLLTPENLVALATLSAMEIVLGIDNIVFIAILTGKLPPQQAARTRTIGLALAMVFRIALLLALGWIMGLTKPLFGIAGHEVSGRDLILLLGGLFLIAKATFEIHHRLEEPAHDAGSPRATGSMARVLAQIIMLDLVFSLDSVITAVGMAKRVEVMIAAIVIAVAVMMVFAGRISRFIERHPSMKMLALAFLLLIGVVLVADGLGQHVGKGYIYFAMAFSLGVELLNLWSGSRRHPGREGPPTGVNPGGTHP